MSEIVTFVLTMSGFLFGYYVGRKVHHRTMQKFAAFSAGFHDAVCWKTKSPRVRTLFKGKALELYNAGYSSGLTNGPDLQQEE